MQSTVAPSPFAALLRRSKLASYDPHIGQVYATFGGHAHRGDWGLKRSLAKRKRNSAITLQSIDSRYQQTEWNHAEWAAKWMRKWTELGREPDVMPGQSWDRTLSGKTSKWPVDSDFAPLPNDEDASKAALKDAMDIPVRIVHAMTDRQFDRYVEQLRKLRPEFRAFLQQLARDRAAADKKNKAVQQYDLPVSTETVSMYQRAQLVDQDHIKFMAVQAEAESSQTQSTTLVQMPHPSAGLSYSHTPALQDYFFSKPVPGRVLQMKTNERAAVYLTAVGGFVGELKVNQSDGAVPLNLGYAGGEPRTDREAGKGIFKVTQAQLGKAPQCVGIEPKGLESAEMTMHVRNWRLANSSRSNPHWPGSRKYVAQNPDTMRYAPITAMSYTPTPSVHRGEPESNMENTKALVKQLQSMIGGARGFAPDDGELG